MANKRLSNQKIIDRLFDFSNSSLSRQLLCQEVIPSFFESTPDLIIELLLYEGVKIKFRDKSYFSNNKTSQTIGFYRNQTREIYILNSLPKRTAISTLHHEVGHFIDHMAKKMYYFSDKKAVAFSSFTGSDIIEDSLKNEGCIYEFKPYYLSSSHEFFAQSYCEYITGTGRLKYAKQIKNHIENILLYFKNHYDLTNFTERDKTTLYFLDNNNFLCNVDTNSSAFKRSNLYLMNKEKGSKKLFSNISNFNLSYYEFCDNEIVLHIADSHFKQSSYLLKDSELLNLGGNVKSLFEDIQQKATYPFLLISDFNKKFNFIFKKDGRMYIMNYFFDKVYKISDSENTIGVGIQDNCIKFIGKDLSTLKTIPGKYIYSHVKCTNRYDLEENNFYSFDRSSIIYVKNNDTINMYSYEGEFLNSCKDINAFTALDDDSNYTDFLFIRYNTHAELLNLSTNSQETVNYEYLDICTHINDLSPNYYHELSFEDNLPSILKIKIDNKWYVSEVHNNQLMNPSYVSSSDDLFIVYSLFGFPYIVGINYHDKNSNNLLSPKNIKNAEIISFTLDKKISNLSSYELISFIETIQDEDFIFA